MRIRTFRRRLAAVAAATTLVGAAGATVASAPPATAATTGGLPALTPAAAASLSRDVTRHVVIQLRQQDTSLPDTAANAASRARALAALQAPVLADLRATAATGVRGLDLVNDIVATVSPGEEARLAADPAVAAVVPDVSVPMAPPPAPSATASAGGSAAAATSTEADCQPGPKGVELDPEALSVIHDDSTSTSEPTAQGLGYTGAGVTVAYMAEQSNPAEPGFQRDGTSVFSDYRDFTGEGTGVGAGTFGGEAVLDASSIAAQGNQLFSLPGCTFRVLGAAPGADLVGLKVFPAGALAATTSALLEGIDWAVGHDHVNVLNQSFGYNPLPDTSADLIRQADDAAVAAGTVVVVSTGDAGPTGTMGSPSTDPAVISAGATTTFRSYAQADIANYDQIGATGWIDDNISALSSSGPAEDLKSPDVVAPGDLNWTLYNPSPGAYGAAISGGTSEAAPLTSATAALVIQAYRESHGGATPSPALVKQIITSTADDLGIPAYEQGSGLLDSYRAVLAARSVHTSDGSPAATGSTVLTSTDQLTATGAPGSSATWALRVTNTGSGTQRIGLAGQVLGAASTVERTTVTLGDGVGEHFNGLNAQEVTFEVPAGVARLTADIAAPTPTSFPDVTLLDPTGKLAAYSLPQGAGDHGEAQVRYPAPGTWEAVITDAPPSSGGYAGPVAFSATVASYQPFGRVVPSTVTLAPGASREVAVRAPLPSTPGDLSAAVVLSTPSGAPTSVAVGLRSLVPLAGGSGSFSAAVTGGNGRGGAPAETRFYQFDVPAGQPALDVATTESGPADDYDLYLVDPQGETVGHGSNQLVVGGTATDPVTVTEPGARVHALAPAAGRWTLVVAASNPVAGTGLVTDVAGTVSFTQVQPVATGLPDSTATTVPAGTPTVVPVTIRNTTPAPEAYFVDARLAGTEQLTLAPYTNATNLQLPLSTAVPTPQWIVPTETTGLSAQAQATAPVIFDWAPYTGYLGGDLNGDPDLGAVPSGDSASGTLSASPVTPGDWMEDPALIGPFTSPASATANLSMVATTRPFDGAVSSTTGDFWSDAAGVTTGTFHAVIVGPGQSTTVYVTIDPTASAGTQVHGTLFVDESTSLSPFGSAVPEGQELAALPYAYTVGS